MSKSNRKNPKDQPFSPPIKNANIGLSDGEMKVADKEVTTITDKRTEPVQQPVSTDQSDINILDILNKTQNKEEKEQQTQQLDMKEFSETYKNIIQSLIETPDDKLKKLTDLEKSKIPELALLETIANYYDFKSAKLFNSELFTLLISKDRKGREELMQIGQLLNQLHGLNMMTNSPMMQMMNPYQMTGMVGNQMQAMGVNNPAMKKKKRFGIF